MEGKRMARDVPQPEREGRRDSENSNLRLVRVFAVFAAIVLLLTVFAVVPRGVSADGTALVSSQGTSTGTTMYGPGIAVTPTSGGTALAADLATFTRWDGVVLPYADLNLSSGDWPYKVGQNASSFSVTRGAWSFTQGIALGENDSFQVDRIKETVTLTSAPPTPKTQVTITVPFETTYGMSIQGTTVDLLQAPGVVAWSTAPWEAWDSASPAHTWSNPVTSVGWSLGVLTLSLNATMLASATYPVYVDPTWTLGGAAGWGASTFAGATTDLGDGSVKLGTLADDFANNLGTGWSTSGTVTFSGGTMNLGSTAYAWPSGTWGDLNLQFSVDFALATRQGLPVLHAYFCTGCTTGGDLKIDAYNQVATLYYGSVLGQFPTTISYGGWNTARIVAQGSHFEVWWNGVRKISATGGSSEGTGGVKYYSLTTSTVSVDNVRIWNSASGTITTAVRDAGPNRPLQTQVVGTVDSYNEVHVAMRSSPNNTVSGPWTDVKANLASGVAYAITDQDEKEYYQLQVTLTSGTNATPVLTQIVTTEGTPGTVTPTANTGLEAWYPYAAGMVNLVNGNLVASATDLSFQGKGFALGVTRTYNSLRYTVAGPFGLGWTFSYNQTLAVASGGNVTWTSSDGSSFLFVAKGTSGAFDSPRGVPDRLVKNGDGTYNLSTTDGSREAFSSAGQLTSLADKNGNALTLTYSGGTPNLLTSVRDATGKTLSFVYDANHHVTSVSDPAHRTVTYAYAASGQLASVTDPLGYKTQYTYTSTSGPILQLVDPVGKSVQVAYVTGGQVSSVTLQDVNTTTLAVLWQFRDLTVTYNTTTTRAVENARGFWTSVTLNSYGNPTSISGPALGCSCDGGGNSSVQVWDGEMDRISLTDGRMNMWSTSYGFRRNVLSTADPGGNTSSEAWLEADTPTAYFVVPSSSTTARGFTSTMAYDARGNRIASTDPGGNTTRFVYDASGFLNETVSPLTYPTWYVTNASGWLVKREDALSETTTYAYDGLGRQVSVTDPMGFTTTTAYDADGRVTNVTDPLGHTTAYTYDARGDLITATDPDRLTTTYTVNVTNGERQTTTDAGGNTTTDAYDLLGNTVSVKDANGHTTSYAYDAFDRLTKVTTPLGYTTTYVYDAAGNRIARTDGNGHTTRYAYGASNRLLATMYPGLPVYASPQTLTYAYDADGNLVTATGFGYTETRTYDRSDRLVGSAQTYPGTPGFTSTLLYAYDREGNLHTETVQDGSSSPTTSFYDAVGRLTGTLDGTQNTTYAYDRDSRQVRVNDPNGITQTTLYDPAGRILAVYTNASGGNLETINYSYDAASLRTYEKDVIASETTATAMAYDLQHRTYSTSVVDSVHGTSSTTDTYDAVGNLVQEVAFRTQTYAVDADNELTGMTSTAGYSIAYEYDQNGNQVASTLTYPDGRKEYGTMSYDYENRMIVDGGCAYTYTPTGDRASDSCNAAAPNERYDAAAPASASNLVVQYNATGTREDRYVSAGTDAPVETVSGSTAYWYSVDGLGSVKRLTDSGGNTVETYAYDVWGGTTFSGSVSNPLEFTARPLDSSGLYGYRARSYDPTSNGGHRFTSQDALGGGYAYVGDSPANFVDPSGMKECAAGRCWYHMALPQEDGSGGGQQQETGKIPSPAWTPLPPPLCQMGSATSDGVDIGSLYDSSYGTYNTLLDGGQVDASYIQMIREWEFEIALGNNGYTYVPHWTLCVGRGGGGVRGYMFVT